MRLKISTVHPLSPFKAWFALDTEVYTIAQLKCTLCARLPIIGLQADNIILVMDGYDLLDDSPISILRDGDAVCIKCTSQPGMSSNRILELPLPATLKRKRHPFSASDISSSSSSASSSSSSSSDDSSSATSSSDSDSDAPTPPRQPVEKRVVATTKSKTPQDNISFVPPGYGKPSTRNRNLRRRRKRLAEHNNPPEEPLAPTSGANSILPLPMSLTRTSSEAYAADAEPESEPQVMMVSLRNKNKKKNFRQLMDKPLPPKIVFAELENAPMQETASEPLDKPIPTGTSTQDKVSIHPVKHARLIPPSERNDLPSNIFVTSVDLEEGIWPKKKRRSKEEPVTASYHDDSCTADLNLDYGPAEVSGVNLDEALHLRAEQQWDSLPKITNVSQVKVDNIVAYIALAINPMTFTPEFLTTVARVTCISSTHMTARPLQRPAQVSFGGLTEETEADTEDETHAWADVLGSDWRVVR
ncbi:hypothetical protein DFH29DRAFT_943544 [Suillus ampliporus]|nr:hypothetical protein DFH29DRAFT_943544 [Suillus ampliporus]